MGTQNANESFNAIWDRAPKVTYLYMRSVQTATGLAIIDFNFWTKNFF